ncbi:MAG: hydrogenase expression/formation protein HypE [Thermodesulfobacteriota bacterium]
MKHAIKDEFIRLDHGSGGELSYEIVEKLFAPAFGSPELLAGHDGAIMAGISGAIAFSTDTFVVDPLFFPGGSIGDLAVNGTVNDVAVCGAKPLYLSAGFVLEEGFPLKDLAAVVSHMAAAAKQAGVAIVTGDTKVVPRRAADKVFINTAGIGRVFDGVAIAPRRAEPGDAILCSGTVADHGVAVLLARNDLGLSADIRSDTAPLNGLVEAIITAVRDVHVLRDITRGGLSSAANEIARKCGFGITLNEAAIPIAPAVAGACSLLGFDPLHIANEGKLIAIVPADSAARALSAMQAHPLGRQAAVIGRVTAENPGVVLLTARSGGARLLPMLTGEQLPRIC